MARVPPTPYASAVSGSGRPGSGRQAARAWSSSISALRSGRARTRRRAHASSSSRGSSGGSLLDAGCGSGVIAVAAARLGFDPIVAADVDPVAVEVARATARQNGVALDVRESDVLRDELPPADVVVANIELAAVEALLIRRLARMVITSGYVAGERPRAEGWTVVRDLELDGWSVHVLIATDATCWSL